MYKKTKLPKLKLLTCWVLRGQESLQEKPAVVFKAADECSSYTASARIDLAYMILHAYSTQPSLQTHHTALVPAVPGHSAVHALNAALSKLGLTADVLEGLPKIDDGACHHCQENSSLLSSRFLHLGGRWGPRPWHRQRLRVPDWFKLSSDWAAHKSTAIPPVTALQPTSTTDHTSTDLTGPEHTARGAQDYPFWQQISTHCQRSFTKGMCCSRLDTA